MPDDVKDTTSIQAYHNYYKKYKSYFAKWTNRTIPDWYNAMLLDKNRFRV